MEEIIRQKVNADHLLYVSLKYTKTCDVIRNLILRWARMIEVCIEEILDHAKSKKKIPKIPKTPIEKVESVRKLFKKNKDFLKVINLYEMFRKIKNLRTEKVGEFRKNVNLKIFYKGKEIDVNLEQLKIYAEILDNFIDNVKKYLSVK
jgi:hypothetical protein